MINEGRWNIPQMWEWSSIGNIAFIIGGGTPYSQDMSNFSINGIPWITPADLGGYGGTYISKGLRSLSEKGYLSSSAQLLPAGSILFSSRAPIGYCVIAINEVSTNQGFKNLILKGDILPEFIRYYLISSKSYASSLARGTTFLELSSARIAKMLVPIAPINEQKRITTKIDVLLTHTKHAQDHLEKIPELLANYKARIIERGVSGKLTEIWRHRKSIPKGNIVCLNSVASNFNYGTSKKSLKNGKVPVLRMGNIQDGRLDWSDLAFTSTQEEIEKYKLVAGDVLFNRTNSPELVGKTAVYKGEREAIFAGYLIRIRCGNKLIPDYLSYCLNSPQGRQFAWRVKSDGISQSNINAKKLANFEFILPSLEEQTEIIRLIESNIVWIDRILDEYVTLSKLLPKLDASILAKAFKGELVNQDPNDEPASQLLERIKKIPSRKLQKKSKLSHTKITKEGEVNKNKSVKQVLSEVGDWIPAQDLFQKCGMSNDTFTEEIELIYSQLRELDINTNLEVKTVFDKQGRKTHDLVRIKKVE